MTSIGSLAGKTAIVTGGANGLGKAYVQALVGAGVHVCFGDLSVDDGNKLAAELPGTKFVPCEVSKWEDQASLFRSALTFSPTNKIHYVVANAGIAAKDDIFDVDLTQDHPSEPSLKSLDVNFKGALYTTKLTLHYFVQQNGTSPSPEQEDTCLVLIGSGAAYFDVPRYPLYSATKWAARGVMHALRRTAFYHGSRVNMISPWYVATNILSKETRDYIKSCGVEFAEASDAGNALLHILNNKEVNGKSFFIAPRKWAKDGFVDLDLDSVSEKGLLGEIQKMQMASAPVEAGLFLSGPGVNTK